MTDPNTVARALARLARGDARAPETEPHSPEPARVVADAEASMQRLPRAAAFVDAGGEKRLRRAIDRAESAGDDALADRGRAVLETLAAFRDAATPGTTGEAADPAASTPSEARTTSTPLAQRSSGEGP